MEKSVTFSEVIEWHTALYQVHIPPQKESSKLKDESSKDKFKHETLDFRILTFLSYTMWLTARISPHLATRSLGKAKDICEVFSSR